MKDHPGFTTFSSLLLPHLFFFFLTPFLNSYQKTLNFARKLTELFQLLISSILAQRILSLVFWFDMDNEASRVSVDEFCCLKKKKVVHKTTTTDDKRLQSTLKRIRYRLQKLYNTCKPSLSPNGPVSDDALEKVHVLLGRAYNAHLLLIGYC
ncbi:hypothetical protein L1987_29175 [Smallanthus sonchifolius]|uniref:Uncharacterized protein n=1 Tax=Smallanthus sonchifolius TaxID=185202 RepID=A0ACB9HZ61_9ASTR|nr:hypothetical protein L1987_29175 [Smallanthus sonchifolius]